MDKRNFNAVLFLGPQDVKDVIGIGKAIDLVEQGYREAADFPIVNAPRRRVHSPEGVRVSNFPGGVPGLGVIGSLTRAESVSHDPTNQVYPYREHPVYLLWDSKTAHLQSIMVGEIAEKRVGFSSVMALRTAATTGVGCRHLARKDARVAGVFGTGGQALHKILALQNERPIETYKVFSRNADNRKAFCEKMRGLVEALDRILSPLYRPIRKVMPDFGGIDFSPLVLLLAIAIVSRLLGGVAAEIPAY